MNIASKFVTTFTLSRCRTNHWNLKLQDADFTRYIHTSDATERYNSGSIWGKVRKKQTQLLDTKHYKSHLHHDTSLHPNFLRHISTTTDSHNFYRNEILTARPDLVGREGGSAGRGGVLPGAEGALPGAWLSMMHGKLLPRCRQLMRNDVVMVQ